MGMISSPMYAIPMIIAIMAAAYWIGRFTGFIAPGQKVFYLADILSAILSIPDMLIKLASKPLGKLPFVQRLQARWNEKLSPAAIRGWFDRYFADEKRHGGSVLLKGDRLAVAKAIFPENEHPYLYKHCPEDPQPQLIVDGRLPNGNLPAPLLAACHIDDQFVADAAKFALKSGAIIALCSFLAWFPVKNMLVPEGVKNANFSVQVDTEIRRDVWSQAELSEIRKEQAEEAAAVAQARVDDVLSGLPSGILTSALLMLLCSVAILKGALSEGGSKLVKPLTHKYKEATIRYKARLDQINTRRRAYIRQLEIDALDKSPRITLGEASGTFRFRGALGAPERGTPVRVSLMDLATGGAWVSGLTGSGKTSTVLKPVYSQLIDIRGDAIKRGEPRYLSFFVGDGKAVLWKDLVGVVRDAGQDADLRVIGVGDDEYGVDLYDGTPPAMVGDTIMSMLSQGKSDGKIWGEAAGDLIKKTGMLLEAVEFTPWGYEYVQKYGERPYSLSTHYKICMDGGDYAFTNEILNALRQAVASDNYLPGFSELATPELDSAMQYVEFAWRNMADETRTSVQFNLNAALSGFTLFGPLRRKFATGGSDKVMKISDVWGSITMLNLSELEHGGKSARLVMIFLKTLLFAEARKREMRDKDIRFKERLFFFFDEFQTAVTTGGPLDDDNFCLVNRSTGLSYFVASQSLTALENVMGEVAARNFAMQLRGAKVMLRTEDNPTIRMMCELSGETLRHHVYKQEHFESFEAMCVENKTSLRQIIGQRARLTESTGRPIRDAFRALRFIAKAPAPVEFETETLPVQLDTSFVHSSGSGANPVDQQVTALQGAFGGVGGGDPALMSSLQAAHWRHEDKLSEWMKEGNQREPVLKTEDILGMGNNALMIVQRAGDLRQDIVYL